jgi:hypothetical protein
MQSKECHSSSIGIEKTNSNERDEIYYNNTDGGPAGLMFINPLLVKADAEADLY